MKFKSAFPTLAASVCALVFAFSLVQSSSAEDSWHDAWSAGVSDLSPFASASPGPTPNPWPSDAFQPEGAEGCYGPGPCWAQQEQFTDFQPWSADRFPFDGPDIPLAGYDPGQTNEALNALLEDARTRFTGPSGLLDLSTLMGPPPSSSSTGGGGGG